MSVSVDAGLGFTIDANLTVYGTSITI
ncbi:Protein of unknown function [Bacillus thuringiensis]|uniref:Uncharacterized protein n=1 Tax=Bacillus thuringiensis TaxID=1428 RepID=A0A1C4DX34_BACTU|nr:Protein of unknown function [Bacillus thuringiensis]